MRYKDHVLRKLEEAENLNLGLRSLLATPSTTMQHVDNQFEKIKNKIEEIKTLVNSEQG